LHFVAEVMSLHTVGQWETKEDLKEGRDGGG
jgi:hypothetical protein